jgi:hypothetical protein
MLKVSLDVVEKPAESRATTIRWIVVMMFTLETPVMLFAVARI